MACFERQQLGMVGQEREGAAKTQKKLPILYCRRTRQVNRDLTASYLVSWPGQLVDRTQW